MTKEELIEDLESLKEWHKNDMLTDADDTDVFLLCTTVLSVIKNCIDIPENATNGDMIKKMFPDTVFYEVYDCVSGKLFGYRAAIAGRVQEYSIRWWNTPYEMSK